MKIKIDDDFDLEKIAESGQCFRFNKCGDGYSVNASDKYLFIKEIAPCEYEFDCSKKISKSSGRTISILKLLIKI